MIRKDLDSIVRALKKDPKYLRLRELFQSSSLYRIPLDTYNEEIQTLHKMRAIRRLNALDPKIVDAVVNAITVDQSNRSRLTEISLVCLRAKTSLEDALEALRHHMLSAYQDELRQFRTKEERNTVLDMVFRQFRKYITNVDLLRATADLVVQDIDKGSWAMRGLIDALKIHHGREVTI